MAEGSIRRACNRCHTQKLSCKRLGNEPCERCVRLKAECKSSPSLRFRKTSNGSANVPHAVMRHNHSSQRDQLTQNLPTAGIESHVDFQPVPLPYPGPYSFDTMAEHLWPGHGVDAGVLAFHSEGHQICPTLFSNDLGFCNEGHAESGLGLMSPLSGLSTAQWPPSSLSATETLPTSLPVSNPWPLSCADYTTALKSTCCPNMSSVYASQDKEGNGTDSTVAMSTMFGQASVGQKESLAHDYSAYAVQHRPMSTFSGSVEVKDRRENSQTLSDTIHEVLVAGLCNLNAQLWEMNNVLPATTDSDVSSSTLLNNGTSSCLHGQCFPMDSLFALSQGFLNILHNACLADDDHLVTHRRYPLGPIPGEYRTSSLCVGSGGAMAILASREETSIGSEQMETGNFVSLADSTYAALLNVYRRVFDLVDAVTSGPEPMQRSPVGAGPGPFLQPSDMKRSSLDTADADADTAKREWVAQSCLHVCRFPDVCVGGFPITSTPSLQLTLGLRLANDFLSQFSNAVLILHQCFATTQGLEYRSRSSSSSGSNSNIVVGPEKGLPIAPTGSQARATTPTSDLLMPPQPPIILAEDVFSSRNIDMPMMAWDTDTTTPVSSASAGGVLFTPPVSKAVMFSLHEIDSRELYVRQELSRLMARLC